MEDKEVREIILSELKKLYDMHPHSHYSKEKIIKYFDNIDENELNRNVKYLQDKKLIEASWYHGGGFAINITAEGIDQIESMKKHQRIPRSELNTIKKRILSNIKSIKSGYYTTSTFISHSTNDIIFIEKLCDEMIRNKIKPILWFEEIKDESVKKKLCEMINNSNSCLIVITEKSIHSQMTNNEIGFLEGKRYFINKYEMDYRHFVLKICNDDFELNSLSGFITKGDDILSIDFKDNEDVIRVVHELVLLNRNNKLYQTEKVQMVTELLDCSDTIMLKKLAKYANINQNQYKSELIADIIDSNFYSIVDYVNKMKSSHLRKFCKKKELPTVGDKIVLERRVKDYFL